VVVLVAHQKQEQLVVMVVPAEAAEVPMLQQITPLLEMRIQAAAAAVVEDSAHRAPAGQVDLESSSLDMQARSAAPAALSHHPAVSPYTPLLRPVHLPHKDNHGTFCKSK
jgi:hypothetical protein